MVFGLIVYETIEMIYSLTSLAINGGCYIIRFCKNKKMISSSEPHQDSESHLDMGVSSHMISKDDLRTQVNMLKIRIAKLEEAVGLDATNDSAVGIAMMETPVLVEHISISKTKSE